MKQAFHQIECIVKTPSGDSYEVLLYSLRIIDDYSSDCEKIQIDLITCTNLLNQRAPYITVDIFKKGNKLILNHYSVRDLYRINAKEEHYLIEDIYYTCMENSTKRQDLECKIKVSKLLKDYHTLPEKRESYAMMCEENGLRLKEVPMEFRTTQLCEIAYKNNREALRYVPEHLKRCIVEPSTG